VACRPDAAQSAFGAAKFTQQMPRLRLRTPIPMIRTRSTAIRTTTVAVSLDTAGRVAGPAPLLSHRFHQRADPTKRVFNPLTGRGPIEGRPPGEFFAHQRWTDLPESRLCLLGGGGLSEHQIPSRFSGPDTNSVLDPRHRALRAGRAAAAALKAAMASRFSTGVYNNLPIRSHAE